MILAAPFLLAAIVAAWRALVVHLRRMDAEHSEAATLAAKATPQHDREVTP